VQRWFFGQAQHQIEGKTEALQPTGENFLLHISPLPEKFLLVVFGVRVTDAFEPFVNSDWYRYELSNVADDPGRTSTILPENAPIVRNSLAR